MAPNDHDGDDARLIDHWTTLRNNLHDPSSWSDAMNSSLTYVPTLSGFTGPAQRDQFCALHGPSTKHPFHPTTSGRFNNQLKRVSISVDKERRMVTEELAMAMLHNERIDWLLPGCEETRKVLHIHFVIIGQLEVDAPHLLHSVRIYWEQAAVWRESGLLSRALDAAARAGAKAYDEATCLDQLLVAEGAKIAVRLMNPTSFNCNQLTPLDCLNNQSPLTKTTTCSLNNLFERQPKRDHPAFKGHDVVIGEEMLSKEFNECRPFQRDNPVFKTTMEFRDDFEPMQVDPSVKSYRLKNIFTDPVAPDLPTLSLDPKRNQSRVFTAEANEQETYSNRSIDPNRFASKIFSGQNEDEKMPANIQSSTNRSRFESRIFDTSVDVNEVVNKQAPRQLVSHIESGQSVEDISVSSMAEFDPRRFASNINFAELNTIDVVENETAKAPLQSTNSLLLGDQQKVDQCEGKKMNKTNVSSILFDFDDPQPVPHQSRLISICY